jgi:hypothetical protein
MATTYSSYTGLGRLGGADPLDLFLPRGIIYITDRAGSGHFEPGSDDSSRRNFCTRLFKDESLSSAV